MSTISPGRVCNNNGWRKIEIEDGQDIPFPKLDLRRQPLSQPGAEQSTYPARICGFARHRSTLSFCHHLIGAIVGPGHIRLPIEHPIFIHPHPTVVPPAMATIQCMIAALHAYHLSIVLLSHLPIREAIVQNAH